MERSEHLARAASAEPLSCSTLLLAVWCALALGRPLSCWLGPDAALLLSFGAASGLVLAARRRCAKATTAPRPRTIVRLLGLGLIAGFAAFPLAAEGIAALGLGLGLAPISARTSGPPTAALVLASLVLSPLFEELLYREHLLHPLARAVGAPSAILLASALFALPHLEPWRLLGSFVVGVALGTLRLQMRHVAGCIAIHGGLNLAALLGAAPMPGLGAPGLRALWLAMLLAALALGEAPPASATRGASA